MVGSKLGEVGVGSESVGLYRSQWGLDRSQLGLGVRSELVGLDGVRWS